MTLIQNARNKKQTHVLCFFFFLQTHIYTFLFFTYLGKIDFKEFSKVTVPVMKDYFDKVRRTKPRLRSRNSRQVWMFHNDPKYPLLSDFHGR